MLQTVWIAVFAASVLLSIAALYKRKASAASSLLGIFAWAVVSLGASNIQVVTDSGNTVSTAAPAVTVLTALVALLHVPVAFLALTGRWEGTGDSDERTGYDAAADVPAPDLDSDSKGGL